MAKSYLLLDPKKNFQLALDALCEADEGIYTNYKQNVNCIIITQITYFSKFSENVNFEANILKLKAYISVYNDFDSTVISTAIQHCCETIEYSEENIFQVNNYL